MNKIYLVTVGGSDEGHMIENDVFNYLDGTDKHFVFDSLDKAKKCFEEQVEIMYKECLVDENKETLFLEDLGFDYPEKTCSGTMIGLWDVCGMVTLESKNGGYDTGIEGHVYLEEIEINVYNSQNN